MTEAEAFQALRDENRALQDENRAYQERIAALKAAAAASRTENNSDPECPAIPPPRLSFPRNLKLASLPPLMERHPSFTLSSNNASCISA